MSDNIVCLIALMTISFCLSMWTFIRIYRRMDAEEAESRKKETQQLYPDRVSIMDLEQIVETRKLTLAQMEVNGNRLAHLYSLPYESWKLIRDHLEGAARLQSWAIEFYRTDQHPEAAQSAQLAKQALQWAYDKLYSPTKGDNCS